MKKPSLPTPPVRPKKPEKYIKFTKVEPITTYTDLVEIEKRSSYDGDVIIDSCKIAFSRLCELMSIIENLFSDKSDVDHDTVKIDLHNCHVIYQVMIENPDYDKKLEKYRERLKLYENKRKDYVAKKKKYDEDMALFNEQKTRLEIKNATKLLKKHGVIV